MEKNRRRRFIQAAVGTTVLGPRIANAQAAFPSRPVRIVFPFPPGGANDATCRFLAQSLAKKWDQAVVVENKPGASSIIATDQVAKAASDGHTLLATNTLIVQNVALGRPLPFDTLRDLVPVTQVNRQQLFVYVRSSLGVKSVEELFAMAKAKPGSLNFGSYGLGSTPHILFEKMLLDTGISMTHVPYKGGAEVTRAMLGGEVDVGVADLISIGSQQKTGTIRLLAVTGPVRSPYAPDVPTLSAVGVNGFDMYHWLGLFAPAATDPALLQRLNEDFNSAINDPEVARRMTTDFASEPSRTSLAEWGRIMRNDVAAWTQLVKQTRITVN